MCHPFKIDGFVKGLELSVGMVVSENYRTHVGKAVRDGAADPLGSGRA